MSWILKKTGPPSAAATCAALKTNIADNKFSLVYFGAETDALYTGTHVPFAERNDKIRFYHADAACGTEYGVTAPGIVFFR